MRPEVEAEIQRILPLIPTDPPEDSLETILGRGYLKDKRLIYGCEWVYDELEGKNVRKVKVICTECGGEAYLPYVQSGCGRYGATYGFTDPVGDSVTNGMNCLCPSCGCGTQALNRPAKGHAHPINDHIFLSIHNVEGHLCMLSWHVAKYVDYYGRVFYKADKYEGVVVIGKTMVRIRGYTKFMTALTWLNHWEYTTRADLRMGCFSKDEVIYSSYEETDGTECEKSALVPYLRGEYKLYPAEYMKLWLKYPNVENMVTAGYDVILNDVISDATGFFTNYISQKFEISRVTSKLDLKKVRPTDILGIEAGDIPIAMIGDYGKLDFYKRVKKKYGIKLTGDQLIFCKKQRYGDLFDAVELAEKNGLRCGFLRLLNYLKKQEAKKITGYDKSMVNASHLRDYWDMVAKVYHGIPPELAFPRDLQKAHDEIQDRIKIEENKAVDADIKKRLKDLMRYTMTDDEAGLTIRPAGSYAEFIKEGKLLHHCVARYADTHAKGGTTIFFIRKLSDPDTPFYTLEYKDGEVVQNRGVNNCSRTPEVEAFEARWLEFAHNLKGVKKHGKQQDARIGA